MKKFILLFMLVVCSMFAEIKVDNRKTIANKIWGVYPGMDEFNDWNNDYRMESTEANDTGFQSISLYRTNSGYYDTDLRLYFHSEFKGLDSPFITIRFKVGTTVIDEDIYIKDKRGLEMYIGIPADTYKILIDKMKTGLPLKIYVKALAGSSTIYYVDNKHFAEQYDSIYEEYLKNNKGVE